MPATANAHYDHGLPVIVFPPDVPTISDVEHTFDELTGDRSDPAARFDGMGSRTADGLGVSMNQAAHVLHAFNGWRARVEESKGRGYWDFFRISEHLILSIAEVRYREDTWFDVPGENVLKIRLLLSGKLLTREKKVLASGPAAIHCVQNSNPGFAYFIAGGIDTKLVILHCKADMLPQTFGVPRAQVPHPFDLLLRPEVTHTLTPGNINVTPALFRTATDILNSRDVFPGAVRNTYLYAKSLEAIGIIVQSLSLEEHSSPDQRKLRDSDVSRVLEAQKFLSEHFANPPTIMRLARQVGLNQTKLKAAFKAVTGLTIFEFVRRCRMERAAELLLTKTCNIDEVSYAVGYTYAANFTNAFKRYFGYLPKQLKSRRE